MLNVWGSAAVNVDLGEHVSPESHTHEMGVIRKTGCNPSHPNVAKAFEGIIANKTIPIHEDKTSANVMRRFEAQLGAYHAQVTAAPVVSKPGASKAPPVIQLLAVEAWPAAFVYDQGALGSCTANSMAFILRYLSIRNSKNPYNFLANPERLDISRLYQYYNTRYYEGILIGSDQISSDVGASMAGSIASHM